MMLPKVVVLTCVWNRPERLEYTLSQLAKQVNQDERYDLTVHLIFNNSDLYPELASVYARFVNYDLKLKLFINDQNYGPFARVLHGYSFRNSYDYFMTIDDDVDFPINLIDQWLDDVEDNPTPILRGHNGFIFQPGLLYWNRDQVERGRTCHYVWGQNLFMSKDLFNDSAITTDLDMKYWLSCDDLWLSYYTSYILGNPPIRGYIDGVEARVDGKDTYLKNADLKIECLNLLRARGWSV